MGTAKSFMSKFGILGELVVFLCRRKRWWLIPIIVVLVLFGILLIVAGVFNITPFIYSLF